VRGRFAIAALALLPAGCQSGGGTIPRLVGAGALRVEEVAPGRGYDYAVTIRDAPGFGYDPGDRAAREALAAQAAGRTCAAPLIVGETQLATGSAALGTATRSYVVRVRCRPA
jgi:hypothetical protein